MKRSLLLTFAFLAINGLAFATISVTVTENGSPTSIGWFNQYNTIDITVTLTDDYDGVDGGTDGNHATLYYGDVPDNPGKVIPYVHFATTNGGIPASGSAQAISHKLTLFTSNSASFTLSEYDITSKNDGSLDEDQKPFDLWIIVYHTNTGETSAFQAVDFFSDARETLIFDITAPVVETWWYPEGSDITPGLSDNLRGQLAITDASNGVYRDGWPFALKKVKFKPSEILHDPTGAETTLKSYIKYLSRDLSDEQIGYIPASNITYEMQEVDFTSDPDVDLTSGVDYYIYTYLVDRAGNKSAVSKLDNAKDPDVWKYDNIDPTLSNVTNIVPSGTGSYGHLATLTYDLNYSEGLRASAGNTITYNNRGTSEISAASVNAVAIGEHKVNVSYEVDEALVDSESDLDIGSFDSGTWQDSAGNDMSSYTFTGTSLSEGAECNTSYVVTD